MMENVVAKMMLPGSGLVRDGMNGELFGGELLFGHNVSFWGELRDRMDEYIKIRKWEAENTGRYVVGTGGLQ